MHQFNLPLDTNKTIQSWDNLDNLTPHQRDELYHETCKIADSLDDCTEKANLLSKEILQYFAKYSVSESEAFAERVARHVGEGAYIPLNSLFRSIACKNNYPRAFDQNSFSKEELSDPGLWKLANLMHMDSAIFNYLSINKKQQMDAIKKTIFDWISLNDASKPTTSCYPSKIIDFALKNLILNELIDELGSQGAIRRPNSKTSCTNNAHALLRIFLGKEEADQVVDKFKQHSIIYYDVDLALDQERTWSLQMRNIFDGFTMLAIKSTPNWNQLTIEEQSGIAKRFVTPSFQNFVEFHEGIISSIRDDNSKSDDEKILGCKEIFSRSEFDFNASIHDCLHEEIIANEAKISEKNSFLYSICMQLPLNATSGPIGEIPIRHMFLIEQYYSVESGVPGYRIYQSCESHSLLNQTVMSKWQFQIFLKKLRHMDRWSREMNKIITTMDCFGFASPTLKPRPTLTEDVESEGFTLGANIVKYYTNQFNPEIVVSNFAELIASNETLTNMFNSFV